MRKDLSKRTPGEALWLRRKAIGLTAYEAAAEAGIGRGSYRDAELDRDAALAGRLAALVPVFEPPPALLLRLARRRSGKGLAGAAKAFGLTRVAFRNAEDRADPRLVRFWQKAGFRFPRSG